MYEWARHLRSGRVRPVVVLSSVTTTKYYLDGLVSGRYGGELVVL